MSFIVKDDNFNNIVMTSDFETLDKPLMVEIVRKRVYPGRMNDIRISKLLGLNFSTSLGSPSKLITNIFLSHPQIGTTLENDMATFLRASGNEFCDINLILDGRVIPAHKSILAARCSYFQAMFRSFMPADNTVNVRKSFSTNFFSNNLELI